MFGKAQEYLRILRGAKLNIGDHQKMTPLLFLMTKYTKNTQIQEYLIIRGAKLNIADHQKMTPLLTAVLNGNTEVVSYLLK